ncbi:MAG: LysM peptidoglycan-binding domain-containing protein [Chloroflexi bacterium]|nr:LysM peptidoglycan-binding domain-containing protein [Chloroflexota bacterium]
MPRSPRATVGLAVTALCVILAPVAVRAEASPTSVHVVQPGDTLFQIALDAGTDTDTLVALNGLGDANALMVGQTLKLPATAGSGTSSATPAASATTSAPSSAATGSYTIAAGDTLWAIAQHFGTTPDALVQLNHLDDANHLLVGTVLSVPGGSGSHAGANPAPSVTAAAATGAPAAGGSTATPGHNVTVPTREHVVAGGETLRDIASAEKVDLGSLIDANQLDDPALIHVGQVLLLPTGASQTAAKPTVAGTTGQSQAAGAGAGQVAASLPASTQPVAAATPASSPTPGASAAPTATSTPAAKPAAAVATVASGPSAPDDALVGVGLKLLGDPYVWGGESPSGFDCSGFVWYVAHQLNKQISRGMLAQYNSGAHPSRDDLKPGDLVFFQNTWAPGLSHNGIYIGNDQFVNAANEASGVKISSLSSAYWTAHWFGATRLL